MLVGLLYFIGAWHEKWEFNAWTFAGVLFAELFFWTGIADVLGCATEPLFQFHVEG